MKDLFKTLIILDPSEVDWIDNKILEIKEAGWRKANRSIFIRSLIKSAMENNVDIKNVSNEDELTNRLISNG